MGFIGQQVLDLEDRLEEAEQQLHQIKSVLAVNFCNRKNVSGAKTMTIWESKEQFNKNTTYQLVLKSLEVLVQQNRKLQKEVDQLQDQLMELRENL